ncbi:MAG: F0F1 ATP synthase subunit A [Nevskia sp.]|nr:F0F1 ATP synthase subunit A [Nevskia sp.]
MNASPLAGEALFHLGPVPVQAQVVTTWAIMLLLAAGSFALTRRLEVERPGRVQALAEWFVELVGEQIRATTRLDPAPYLPLIATLFLFILCANLSSLVPGNEPPTAHIETDAALGAIVFFATIYFGVRGQGPGGYLRSFARPTWIMIPLNLVEALTRTFSLMVRLFGNIMSGVFVIGIVLSLAGLFVPIPFMALEVLTGVVQAYIFAVLATVFIGAAAGDEG